MGDYHCFKLLFRFAVMDYMQKMVCCGNCKDTLLISAFDFKLRNQIRAKAFHLISLEEKVTTLCEQK